MFDLTPPLKKIPSKLFYMWSPPPLVNITEAYVIGALAQYAKHN